MSTYTYIRDNTEFQRYLERLKGREVRSIALDIEGEFNLHVYGERFCLLQLFDGSEEAVVDPLAVSGELLKRLLEDRDLLKITYDSASDRVLMAKTHGIVMNSILDLKPAVELLEFPKQDLKSVLETALGIQEAGSKKRFQQYNWTLRPIDPGAVDYALQDVRHLFALKDALLGRLSKESKIDFYILENLKRQDQQPDVDRKAGVLRSGRFKRLGGAHKKEFERIFDIRERHARDLDLPPNTVVANNDLFAVVTGGMSIKDIRGNRRVPAAILETIKREMGQGSG